MKWEAAEDRTVPGQTVSWATYLLVLAMAVAGFWWWRPTGRAAIVLFGPIVLVSMTAVLILGNQRFRIIAEPTLLIGAAWFLVDWWDRRLAG